MAEEDLIEESGGSSSTAKAATFYQWKHRHYFTVVEESDKNMRVRCKLCMPSNKTLSSARNTTSNLKKHLDTVHKTTPLVSITPDGKGKRKLNHSDNEEPSQIKKQCTLPLMSKLNPTRVRNLVAEYIIEDMLPLSTVESLAFKKLICGISSGNVQLPDRKSLTLFLDKAYESMLVKIKGALEAVERVCTTADAWTANRRSYLGMTVHWIDPSTLKRRKAAIACARLTGHHTCDVLAAKIIDIHEKFGLSSKISATVTDNGSNFVKAFATFALPDVSPTSSVTEDELEEEVIFENVNDLMVPEQLDTQDDLTQIEYELPPHQRCAAHTLNLVASTDVDKFLSSSPLSRNIYRSSFSKCTALWNKASRSTIASDQIQERLKRKLLVPSPTRWNSFYDAVERVVENSIVDLNDLCVKFDIRCFNEKEVTFLKEYCAVLQPLSRGLDILQGEDNCFYGTLLPTLETIIRKLKDKKSELSGMMVGLVTSIDSAIKRRFSQIFDSHDAIIAAVASPKFKLRWVEKQEKKDQYRQMLLDEMRLFDNDEIQVEEFTSESQEKEKKKDFYEFDSDDETLTNTIDAEATEYFNNAKKLECLSKYPTIKKIFLRYNTTIPSSAPVERLFSLGGLVLTPRRNRLTDARFEKILLMRYNKDFVDLK